MSEPALHDFTAVDAAYERASRRLLGLIRGNGASGTTGALRQQLAQDRLIHTRKLLTTFGDPQHRVPMIHVTGTSGKGSVSAMVAAVLTRAGYRVGLRTSPYVQVATEKLQIGPTLIDAGSLDTLSARVVSAHEGQMAHGGRSSRLRYNEAWTVMTMLWFFEERVDLGIVEVGAGGRFDSTNVFDPVVSIITTIGRDHTSSLGPGIADIAWHKAGIIKSGSTAVVGAVPAEAWHVIRSEASTVGARVVEAPVPPQWEGLRPPSMVGAFQQSNAGITAAAIATLRERGWAVPNAALEEGLTSARMPARLELMPVADGPLVWIDGAHNEDKVSALRSEGAFVSDDGRLPVTVVGIMKSKDAAVIARGISAISAAIVATEPRVTGKTSLPARELADAFRAAGFTGVLITEPDPVLALSVAESMARTRKSHVLATGSLYLAGQLRRRWYPDADIVRQRTPWPAPIDHVLLDRSVAL